MSSTDPLASSIPWLTSSTLPFQTDAFRAAVEQSLSHARKTYDAVFKAAADNAAATWGSSPATAGFGAYGSKLIENARDNTNALFDATAALLASRSLAEVAEVSTAHASRQFSALQTQAHELGALAQKAVGEVAAPLADTFARVTGRSV